MTSNALCLAISILFVGCLNSFAESQKTVLLEARSSWHVDDDGKADPGWQAADFDHSAWPSKTAPIGYGKDGWLNDRSLKAKNSHTVVYFRKVFTLDDPAKYPNAHLRANYDDGIIAYLNGQEIGRSKSMAGKKTNPDSHEGGRYETIAKIESSKLRKGKNVLAIELHNRDLNSSDIGLDASIVDGPVEPAIQQASKPGVSRPDTSKHNDIITRITPLKGSTPAQWRLSWKEDPAHKATLSWSTAAPEGEHLIYFDTVPHKGKLEAYANRLVCHLSGKYSLGKNELKAPEDKRLPDAYYHHARMAGLQPNTTYYVVMVSNGVASREFHFKTAPIEDVDMSFIHGGDSRSGITARTLVNDMISQHVSKHPEVLAFIHGGDYIGSGQSWAQWRMWLSQNELITTPEGRLVPIVPAKGNHDGGILIAEIFDFDQQKQIYYYDVSFGPQFALVTLDTNIAGTGAQESYLKEALPRLRPDHRWLMTQYHRPLWPAVKGVPGHKNVFVPIFDRHNVDMALEADGHCMKRTVRIRNDKADPTGIVYLGEGGLGVGQRRPDPSRWYLKADAGAMVGSAHHIVRLDLSEDKLRSRFIQLDGSIADDYSQSPR